MFPEILIILIHLVLIRSIQQVQLCLQHSALHWIQ